jgi:rhamnosyltransferase
MPAPRCSVCIPTWNGARDLERLLPALAAQELAGGVELVAVDSSSSDRTRELLEAAGARVRVIAQRDFRHGATRNLLAEEARGELIVLLSQDAVPAGPGFLAALLAPFEDPRVAGAYARILPHPTDDPLTARTALDQPEAADEPRVAELPEGTRLEELSPAEQSELARFNNVASALRAEVLRDLPFPDVAFGEDAAWARRALEAGWRVAFAPAAVVHHAHAYGPREAFRRYRVDAVYQREVHGRRIRPGAWSVLRGFCYEVLRDLRHLSRTPGPGRVRAGLRSPVLRAAQVLGQRAGSRGPLGP